MKPCVIFDIDGTLADIEHRRPYAPGNYDLHGEDVAYVPSWKEFFARIPLDTPNKNVVTLAALLYETGIPIVLATGRSECHRATTQEWMLAHSISYDLLYMRTSGDGRPDHVVKRELLARIRADGFEPWLVVDDRQSVVDMWRSEGLTCLQCAPGDF